MDNMMDNSEGGSCSDPIAGAIDLHQQHMDDPASATPESQQELMDLLKEHQSMMGEGEGEAEDSMMPQTEETTPYNRDNMMAMMMKRKATKPER